MSLKIDLRDVFADHVATLRDDRTGRPGAADIIIFLLVPIAGAVASFILKIDFDSNTIGVLVSALSILAGLLINVLVLLYTVREVGPTRRDEKRQKQLIQEVNANLLYEITISIVAIILLCSLIPLKSLAATAGAAASVALLLNFLLTLLMVVKRLRILLGLRFKESGSE